MPYEFTLRGGAVKILPSVHIANNKYSYEDVSASYAMLGSRRLIAKIISEEAPTHNGSFGRAEQTYLCRLHARRNHCSSM